MTVENTRIKWDPCTQSTSDKNVESFHPGNNSTRYEYYQVLGVVCSKPQLVTTPTGSVTTSSSY